MQNANSFVFNSRASLFSKATSISNIAFDATSTRMI